MPPALSIDQHAAKVFISYSRKDSAFAEQLVSALSERQFSAYLDTKDIAPGEPWQKRLGKLILAADAVVFLLSPDAVKSPICRWEVEEAGRRQKRVLPVVHRPTELAAIPPESVEWRIADLRRVRGGQGSRVLCAGNRRGAHLRRIGTLPAQYA